MCSVDSAVALVEIEEMLGHHEHNSKQVFEHHSDSIGLTTLSRVQMLMMQCSKYLRWINNATGVDYRIIHVRCFVMSTGIHEDCETIHELDWTIEVWLVQQTAIACYWTAIGQFVTGRNKIETVSPKWKRKWILIIMQCRCRLWLYRSWEWDKAWRDCLDASMGLALDDGKLMLCV